MMRYIQSGLRALSLSQQFAIVAIAVILPGMAVTGWWISKKVSDAVVRNTASAIYVSMDSLLAPFADEIEKTGGLSSDSRGRLDALLASARSRKTIVSMKIWGRDGTIFYSSFSQMIGQKFELSDNFLLAARGEVAADLDEEPHVEDKFEKMQGISLLEVYAPLREPDAAKIVGVAEFYANGSQLSADVWSAVEESWLFVCAITALMAALLSGIAVKGGRTIASQQKQLQTQVSNLSELLSSNESLREKLRLANEDVSSVNEMVLQHVGADLHDGPAQKLAYISMRLSALRKQLKSTSSLDDVQAIVFDTLADIRRMSGGLILPELQDATLREAVERAVNSHESYTGTHVDLMVNSLPEKSSLALKTCVYRIVQEALSNVFRHARGSRARVSVRATEGQLLLEVTDSGPGISQTEPGRVKGLGLRGMQARVDALGGTLTVLNGNKGGTQLTAVLPLSEERDGKTGKGDQSGAGRRSPAIAPRPA